VSETHTRKDSSINSEDLNNVKDRIKEALERNNEEEKESKVKNSN
jgi:trehalose-6-phosphate synthase